MFYSENIGTPRELGFQFGRDIALQIGSMLDYLTKGFRHWDAKAIAKARDANMALTERTYPDLMEELEGIAEGSQISLESLYLMNFYALLRHGNEGCSNLILPRTEEGPLLLKTNDLPVHEGHHGGVRSIRPKGGMAMVFTTCPGTVWAGSGVNEAGLAMGGSSCAAKVPRPPEVLSPHLVIRKVLGEATTVREAIAILKEMPVTPWGLNLAIVDRHENATILEKAGGLQGERVSRGDPIFCANHALTAELAPFREMTAGQLQESEERFAAMQRLTEAGSMDNRLAKGVAAYGGRPGALSRYGDDDPLGYETEYAAILYCRDPHAEICFSHAERDPWRTFCLPTG